MTKSQLRAFLRWFATASKTMGSELRTGMTTKTVGFGPAMKLFEQYRSDASSDLHIPASVNDLENKYEIRDGKRRLDWTSFSHSIPALLRHLSKGALVYAGPDKCMPCRNGIRSLWPDCRQPIRDDWRFLFGGVCANCWFSSMGTIGLPSGHGRH